VGNSQHAEVGKLLKLVIENYPKNRENFYAKNTDRDENIEGKDTGRRNGFLKLS